MSENRVELLSAFRYVVPAQYEQWFEGLAAKGWHPIKVGQWSSIAMRFVKGTPERYRYVVDLQAVPQKGYKQIYEEFGWEYVGRMSNLFVWRKPYEDERPESFSDAENLRARNQRFVWAISFSLIVVAIVATLLTGWIVFHAWDKGQSISYAVGAALGWGVSFYLGSVMRKIKRSVRNGTM